ncbi:MAG: DUF5610 domain-containing protein [Halopseudomonas sp.]
MHITSNHSDLVNRHDSHNKLSSNGQEPATKGASATDVLLEKLAQKVPGMKGAEDFKQLDARDFTPKKVAGRITDFVEMGLEQARKSGKSESEVEALRQQAMSGIQKGFAEARSILDNMNLLTDEVSANIDDTLKQTMSGLEGLAPSAVQQSFGGSRTSVLAAERYQAAETLSLKVTTQDGDEVTIKFDKQSDYQSSFGGYADSSGSAVSFSVDRSESSNYRFSVEGDLDDDEIDALQDLIKDVNEIADDFFDGDVQAAFDQASEFRMDKTELASMNLQLTRSARYTAVSAYEQVQNHDSANQGPGRKLGHMMHDLAGSLSNPGLGFIESPFDLGKDLMTGLINQDQRVKEADDDMRSLIEQRLQGMRDIIDGLAAAHELEED